MTVEPAAGRAFQPFEYMAWAKQVAPGAPFPMQRSGLPGPHPSFVPALPACVSLVEDRTLHQQTAERLTAYLGASDRALTFASGASEALFVALAPLVVPGQPVIVEN